MAKLPPVIQDYVKANKPDSNSFKVSDTGTLLLVSGIPELKQANKMAEFLTSRSYLVTVLRGNKQGTSWNVTARHLETNRIEEE